MNKYHKHNIDEKTYTKEYILYDSTYITFLKGKKLIYDIRYQDSGEGGGT